MNARQLDVIRVAARKLADGWPPLTAEQLDKVAVLLRPTAPVRTTSKAA